MIRPVVVAGGVVLCVLTLSVPGVAQQTGAAPPSTGEVKPPKGHKRESEFRALAPLLQTTPAALDVQYQAARKANPFLKRKQFVTALVVAHDLAGKHPAVTADTLLAGLKDGKPIAMTLQALGLSAADAAAAEKAAKQEAQAAGQP